MTHSALARCPKCGSILDELDAAYIAMLDATISAAWLDGWQCGRNPDLLVMGPADGGDE